MHSHGAKFGVPFGMKIFALLLSLLSFSAFAADIGEYLKFFDSKVYSLKTKGVKDFTVEVASSRLTKQLNDLKSFGEIKNLKFKIYWTANPERLDIEVIGLPDGFQQLKDELKASILPLMDNLLPMTLTQRFPGYKFTSGKEKSTILATDSTGLAPIPSYSLQFDSQDRLIKIVGNRPLGTQEIDFTFEKKAFTDGKWALVSVVTETVDAGQTISVTRKLNYGTTQGIGTLSSVEITTEQVLSKEGAKPVAQSDQIEFYNYQINSGAAFKHFLSDSKSN